MSVFTFLKASRTAAQLREAIPRLEDDLRKAEASVSELKASREETIFSGGEAEVAKLQLSIRDAENRVEMLTVALAGARRRAAETEAAEHNAALEARHLGAKSLCADERRLLKAWHKTALQLADLTAQADQVQKQIAAHNSYMVEQGRRDLELPRVATELSARRRELWERFYADNPNKPVNPPQAISLNVAHEVRINGYYPAPSHDGGPLPVQHLALLD